MSSSSAAPPPGITHPLPPSLESFGKQDRPVGGVMSALPGCTTSPSNSSLRMAPSSNASAPARSHVGPPLEKTELAMPTDDRRVELELEGWSRPSVNRYRYLATVFGLGVMGMNDACLGALLPYVRTTFHGLFKYI